MPQGNPIIERGTLVGQVVNGLEIVRLLGAGGMGEVYLARHKTLGIHRAIKVIHDNYRDDGQVVARFEREAVALSRLEHPNIVRIIDFGALPNGWPFLSMEYLEGRNLDEQVKEHGPLPLADALQVLGQLASALAHAHGQGIVHRDLKPANTILQKGDVRQLKVIDFGLARVISKELMTRLTASNQMVGSPFFMAPEQAKGTDEITWAADVYALAGIAYVLLSGKPVFSENTVLALICAHLQQTPERLSARCPQLLLPRRLDDLLFACLEKEPQDRPAIDEVRTCFSQLAREVPAHADASARVGMANTVSAEASLALTGRWAPVPAEPPILASEGGGLAELLFGQVTSGDEPSGLRSALVNQLCAVIMDLAGVLSDRDARVAASAADVQHLHEEITSVEVELALIESQINEGQVADRAPLQRQRAEVIARAAKFRERLETQQAELAALVERARPSAGSGVGGLYGELDELVGRLRALTPR